MSTSKLLENRGAVHGAQQQSVLTGLDHLGGASWGGFRGTAIPAVKVPLSLEPGGPHRSRKRHVHLNDSGEANDVSSCKVEGEGPVTGGEECIGEEFGASNVEIKVSEQLAHVA